MKKEEADISWKGFLSWLPRRQVTASVLYGGVRVLLSAAWPYLLYNFLKKSGSVSAASITLLGVAIVIVFILIGLAHYRQSVLSVRILRQFSLNLSQRLWIKMNSLTWLGFYGKNRVYFFDALMVDAWRVRQGIAALLESIIVNSFIVTALTCTIIIISLPMFILCAAGLLVISAVHYYSTLRTRAYIKRFQSAWRSQHLWVSTAVDQFSLLKMGRGYDESAGKNLENTQAFLSAHEDMLLQQSKWKSINTACANVLRLIVFITGIYWVQAQYIGLASMLLVLLIVAIIQNTMATVPAAITSFMEGQEAAHTLESFFAQHQEDDSLPPLPASLQNIQSIVLQNVSYAYNGNSGGIANLNMALQKGKIYLWKGANGSGKSTSAHILLGLIQPQGGTFILNGQPVAWQALQQLRKHFAFVHQDALLFPGTIQQNLLFGHAQPGQAWQGAQTSWLAKLMPGGEKPETRTIGERGEGLSGGEARRLALIREWMREASLVILDEPLNHLDGYAMSEIMKEAAELKKNAVVIIISHQKGFENIADEIVLF